MRLFRLLFFVGLGKSTTFACLVFGMENTLESVWEAFRETDRLIKASSADFDRRIKKLEERYGSVSNNLGNFAEEYFFNSPVLAHIVQAFENGKQDFFGEEFDDIERNMKGYKKNYKDEYDIVLFNGKSVAIVETKFRAHENDLPKIVKKAETFRINYPDFANHRIYLGLASLSFYDDVEKKCIDEGIAVVKQVGNTVVIADEHLKEF